MLVFEWFRQKCRRTLRVRQETSDHFPPVCTPSASSTQSRIPQRRQTTPADPLNRRDCIWRTSGRLLTHLSPDALQGSACWIGVEPQRLGVPGESLRRQIRREIPKPSRSMGSTSPRTSFRLCRPQENRYFFSSDRSHRQRS